MEALDEAMAAAVALANVYRVVSDLLEKRLRAEAGLSLAQFEVLLRLSEAPRGRLRMIDLSGRLCVSKSGITQLVDRLEEAGLVEREASTSDRRLTYARIMPQGRKTLRQARPVIGSAVEEHFARHLSGDEMRSLHKSLLKVLVANTVPAAAS